MSLYSKLVSTLYRQTFTSPSSTPYPDSLYAKYSQPFSKPPSSPTIVGSDGNEPLIGEQGIYYGRKGNDVLIMGEGSTGYGDSGQDSIYSDKNSVSYGGEGNDKFIGTGIHYGGKGRDIIAGNGEFYGNSGDDTISGWNADEKYIDFWFDNHENVNLQNDTFYGNSGNDLLDGRNGDDLLFGGFDSDTLYGGDGNDSLDGGSGNDFLDGESGDDMLKGYLGDDIFFFGEKNGQDIIRDFEGAGATSGDLIEFSQYVFSMVNDVLDAVTYDSGNAVITIDTNNSVTLLGMTSDSLTADDFVII